MIAAILLFVLGMLQGRRNEELLKRLIKNRLNAQLKALVAELSLKNRILTPVLAGGAREKSSLGRETKWDESDELVYLEYTLHNKTFCK